MSPLSDSSRLSDPRTKAARSVPSPLAGLSEMVRLSRTAPSSLTGRSRTMSDLDGKGGITWFVAIPLAMSPTSDSPYFPPFPTDLRCARISQKKPSSYVAIRTTDTTYMARAPREIDLAATCQDMLTGRDREMTCHPIQ